MSFPDSSMNILHENPTIPNGCNSFLLINTEGDIVFLSLMIIETELR